MAVKKAKSTGPNRTSLLMLACLPSCAAIVAPKASVVPIDSSPPGATVRYRDANVGVTPCSVRIEVGETKAVLVRDGFHDQWIDVGKGTSGWIIGNLVSWGILGLFVDAVGGANVVSDGPCLVELTPATDAAPAVWERPKPSASQDSSGTYAWSESNQSSPTTTRQPLRPTRAPALDVGTQPPAAKAQPPEG
jgi:hypothetical protein